MAELPPVLTAAASVPLCWKEEEVELLLALPLCQRLLGVRRLRLPRDM